MKTPSITRAAALLCLWPIVAISAFASQTTVVSSTTTLPSSRCNNFHGLLHNKHHQQQQQHQRGLHKQTGTNLHLSIPRGGAIATAAASSSSKLSQWTSTPSGTFNIALAILAATTAALKLFNKVDSSDGGKDGDSVEEVSFIYLTQ